MKLPFRIFWHLTAIVLAGLFCFAAGRTSGIHDCQKDYLLRSLMKNEYHLENNQRLIEQGIQQQGE
jgi:hypothetical protein